jgi:hypothetical protein
MIKVSFLLDIARLAVNLADDVMEGKDQEYATVTDTVLQILQKGDQVYEQHTGEALDPSLLKEEKPI